MFTIINNRKSEKMTEIYIVDIYRVLTVMGYPGNKGIPIQIYTICTQFKSGWAAWRGGNNCVLIQKLNSFPKCYLLPVEPERKVVKNLRRLSTLSKKPSKHNPQNKSPLKGQSHEIFCSILFLNQLNPIRDVLGPFRFFLTFL